MARDTRRFAAVTPNWRRQLQPPRFTTPASGSVAGRRRYLPSARADLVAGSGRAGRRYRLRASCWVPWTGRQQRGASRCSSWPPSPRAAGGRRRANRASAVRRAPRRPRRRPTSWRRARAQSDGAARWATPSLRSGRGVARWSACTEPRRCRRRRGLVEDTVRLVDRLQSIVDTGSGVASMKDSAAGVAPSGLAGAGGSAGWLTVPVGLRLARELHRARRRVAALSRSHRQRLVLTVLRSVPTGLRLRGWSSAASTRCRRTRSPRSMR